MNFFRMGDSDNVAISSRILDMYCDIYPDHSGDDVLEAVESASGCDS